MTDSRIDTSRPHPARRYNYWLGGKDNFEADRASGDAIANDIPWIRNAAVENRRFLQRAVRFLACEMGIRQFLDIGTGLPTAGNTHEIAQGIAPKSRIVYVDNDPVVMVHARALLTTSPEGRTAYVEADAVNPDDILAAGELRDTLDFREPIALLLVAILHFIPDDAVASEAVQRLVEPLPAGSYVVLSHSGLDLMSEGDRQRAEVLSRPESGHGPFRARDHGEIAEYVRGLQLVEPGLVPVQRWRPETKPRNALSDDEVGMYGVVACKGPLKPSAARPCP